jgi:hypothetical protein
MVLRLAARSLVAPIIVLATSAAVFRVYTAPDRITQRLQTAKETCGQAGGTWTTDERGTPHCKRD